MSINTTTTGDAACASVLPQVASCTIERDTAYVEAFCAMQRGMLVLTDKVQEISTQLSQMNEKLERVTALLDNSLATSTTSEKAGVSLTEITEAFTSTCRNELTSLCDRLASAHTETPAFKKAKRATEGLSWVVSQWRCGIPLDVAQMEQFLRDGADVSYQCLCHDDEGRAMPILHFLTRRGCAEGINALMKHAHCVNFSVKDATGKNPLHLLCSYDINIHDTKNILHDMVGRVLDFTLPQHYITRIDWEQKDDVFGIDFLSTAAKHGCLSLVWNEVHQVSFFDDQPYWNIELAVTPQPTDWGKLDEKSRNAFAFYKVKGQKNASKKLRQLIKEKNGRPTVQEVESCIWYGADIVGCKIESLSCYSILSYYFLYGNVDVAEALLQTPRAVDFTVTEHHGYTPLHLIFMYPGDDLCYLTKTVETMFQLLQLVIDREAKHSVSKEDTIDWLVQDFGGRTILELAVLFGCFARLVKLLFEESFIEELIVPNGGIKIINAVDPSDWNELSPFLKAKFALIKGVKQRSL